MTYKLYTLDNQLIKKANSYPNNFTGIVEYSDGSQQWRAGGRWHRLDGPAIECPSGLKIWRIEGQLHRLGGAAIERSNGTKEWWVYGKRITEEQHNLLYSIMKLKGLV